MQKNIPEVDVVLAVLKKGLMFFPGNNFLTSLLVQYQERGSLSKKQLEGLYDKASKVKDMPVGKLATLQAIIIKKPTRYKSTITKTVTVEQDDTATQLITDILQKYPNHKRVLFLQLKNEGKETLTSIERSELERLHKLLFPLGH